MKYIYKNWKPNGQLHPSIISLDTLIPAQYTCRQNSRRIFQFVIFKVITHLRQHIIIAVAYIRSFFPFLEQKKSKYNTKKDGQSSSSSRNEKPKYKNQPKTITTSDHPRTYWKTLNFSHFTIIAGWPLSLSWRMKLKP